MGWGVRTKLAVADHAGSQQGKDYVEGEDSGADYGDDCYGGIQAYAPETISARAAPKLIPISSRPRTRGKEA